MWSLKCRVRRIHPPLFHFSNIPRSFFLHRRPLPLLPCLPCRRHFLSLPGSLRLGNSLNEIPVLFPPMFSFTLPYLSPLLSSTPSYYIFLPCRPLRPFPDAPTNPPPQFVSYSPLSCPRSNLTLVFVPSSQVNLCIYLFNQFIYSIYLFI